MLSIIICSYRDIYYKSLVKNIKDTIGVIEYELIQISNPRTMSISEAYNLGASKTIYNNLLFIHEDIEFLTHGWGNFLIESLKIENIGILGVAGGTRKFNLPTGHDQGIDEDKRLFVKHHKNENLKSDAYKCLEPVRTLDGVFLAMRKLRWRELMFNEELKGFHFYDIDITLRASKKFQNYVTSRIPILHFSMGNFNDEWVNASLEFHKKNYNFDVPNKIERKIVSRFWLRRLLYENISFKNRLLYINNIGFEFKNLKSTINFLIAKRVFK